MSAIRTASVFLRSVAADLVDWTLYHVSDWKKVGAAESYLASLRAMLENDSFVPQTIPFAATADDQAQFVAASSALKRLTNGWTTGKKSGNPVEHEARYPEFIVLPYDANVPETYQVTVPVLKKDANGKMKKDGDKTKVVTRNARAGLKIHLRAAYLVEQSENAS